MTVAVIIAGIISSLHLLQLARTRVLPTPRHRARIQQTIDRLRALDDRSGIARRGSIFIDYLYRAEADISNGLRSDIRFTRESILGLIQTVDEVPDNRQTSNPILSGFNTTDLYSTEFPIGEPQTDQSSLHDPIVPWYPHSADFDFTTLLNDFMTNGQS